MTKNKTTSTIRDVARLAGVSVATVSRYINQNAPLAENTRDRVQAAMNELSFIPHLTARNLATHRTNNIGLVVENIGGDFFTPLLDGMVSVTQANNYNLLIFNGIQPGMQNLNRLGPGNTDGLMVFLDALDEDSLCRLSQIGHPIVLIHQSPPSCLQLPLVTIENKGGACRLIDHLIEVHGKNRIVFLRGPKGNEDSSWREAGYRESLEKHGLPFDESLIAYGDYDRFVALENLGKLIASGVTFDAVFAADDDSAIGALQALREAHIDVPSQVSVVGFDDQRLAPFLSPALTTVHAPTMQIGAAAAENLLHLIRHEPVPDSTLLPTDLVIRASCGCRNG
jgi:LacI family transcriptional regulator